MKKIWHKKSLLRIIAFTLCLTILCPVNAFAKENEEAPIIEESILKSDEFIALRALGMTSPLSEFNTEDEMTRGDFSYVLARLSGYSEGYKSVRTFSDLSETDGNKDAIGFLADVDILTGAGNGIFNPDDAITYAQAAKMAVVALGYSQIAEVKYNGFPTGYLTMANQLNLFRGIKSDFNKAVSCADAFKILYQTAKTDMAVPKAFIKENIKLGVEENKNLLSVNHDIYLGEGIMTDNGITSLDGATAFSAGGVVIGNVSLTSVKEGFMYSNFIGEKLEFWYDAEIKELIYAYSLQNESSVLKIPYDKLATDDSGFAVTQIVYYDEDEDVEYAEISATHKMIYNGAAYPAHTAADLKINSGYLELIDIDEDGIYDVIKAYEALNDVIYHLEEDRDILKIKYNDLMLDLSEWKNVSVIMADGRKGDIKEFAIGQPISLYCSKDKTSLIIVDCSEIVVIGSLDELDIDNSELVIGGESYSLAKNALGDIAALSIGSSYTFYRDADGAVFAVDNSTESGWTLAYYVAMDKTEGLNETVRVKAVTTGNKVEEYTLDDKVSLNGVMQEAKNLLADARLVRSSGTAVRQLLRFKFNSEGNVSEMKVAVDNTLNPYRLNLSEFSKDYSVTGSVKSRMESVYIIAHTFLVKADTKIFVDPYMDDESANGETDGVQCLARSNMVQYENITNCDIYDLDERMQITAMVTKVLGLGVNSYEKGILTVGTYSQVINAEGDVVGRIRGVVNNYEMTWTMTDDCVLDGIDKIEPGYVFRVRRNIDGKIEALQFLYDLNDKSVNWTDPVNHPYGENTGHLYSPIYSASENGVVTIMPESGIERGHYIMGTAFTSGTRNGALYDRKTKKLRLASGNDLYGTCVPADDGSFSEDESTPWIFIRRANSYVIGYVLVIN